MKLPLHVCQKSQRQVSQLTKEVVLSVISVVLIVQSVPFPSVVAIGNVILQIPRIIANKCILLYKIIMLFYIIYMRQNMTLNYSNHKKM